MKHDPNQTKTVVLLIVVLAGAIGFTVMRLTGGGETPPVAKQAAAQQSAAASGGARCIEACDLARDPFDKPRMFQAALEIRDAVESRVAEGVNATANPEPNPYAGAIRPVDPASGLALTPLPGNAAVRPADPAPKPAVERAASRFELLATVRGSGGWSAVIKTDDSQIRVVDVGDTVGNGFKVMRIETGRVVLKDGRITIIAKRPQS